MTDWRRGRLGDHAQISARIGWRGLSADEYVDSGPFLIAGKHIVSGSIDWASCDHLTEDRYRESPEIALQVGDVIVSKDGTIGRVARIDSLPGPATLNGTMMLVRPTGDLDYEFLSHLLSGTAFKKLVEERISGSSVPHLFQRDLVTLRVSLPPLEEQRRIAKILDTIDEAFRTSGRIIQKLQQIKKGLLLEMLRTYFPGSGPLSVRASHYVGECVPLSALLESREVELGRGKVISFIDITNNPGPYPIYSSSASASGEFGKYGRFMFDEELITWSTDGGGRPFHRPRHRFSVTNVGGFLRIRANRHWTYRFVHALMEAQHSQLTFDWQSKAHPSVIRDLYWFPRVSLREQHQVAHRLDVADATIRQEKAQMAKLDWLRAGLAADLLSGEVRAVAT